MSRLVYAVQAFRPLTTALGRRLIPEPVSWCQDARAARDQAESLARSAAGVLAYSMVQGSEPRVYSWPQVIYAAGEIPEGFIGD